MLPASSPGQVPPGPEQLDLAPTSHHPRAHRRQTGLQPQPRAATPQRPLSSCSRQEGLMAGLPSGHSMAACVSISCPHYRRFMAKIILSPRSI